MLLLTEDVFCVACVIHLCMNIIGSGGVAYGFIGANTSADVRNKYMSLYRVTCMAGVLFSTIGECHKQHGSVPWSLSRVCEFIRTSSSLY